MKIKLRIPTDPVCFSRGVPMIILWIGMQFCPIAASFGQQLYWSDFGANSMANQSVGHVALDGTGPVTIHRTTSPFGMATLGSTGQVYWLEGAGLVTNSNADLSNPHALTTPTATGILNLAIDPAADIVLWTGYSPPGIRRARLSDGASLGSISLAPGQTPDDIAVDPTSRKVYWTDIYGGITRANYDGTSQEPLVPAGALGTGSAGIDLDLSAGKMYLSYTSSHTIARRNLDGTNVETVLTLAATENPVGMELYAGRMYWCDLTDFNGRLRSATTSGADVKTILSGLDSPRAVSVLGLAGDFNGNGVVDTADYVVWRKGVGTTYSQSDYDVWRAHFGQTAGSGSGASANAAVPEPTTMALLMFAATASRLWRRRAI